MKLKTPKKLTIDRRYWLRGSISMLLDGYGNMCCLGFYCEKAGVSKNEMEGAYDPNDLNFQVPRLTKKIRIPELGRSFDITNFTEMALLINDNELITNQTREKQLQKLFKENGIELEFIN